MLNQKVQERLIADITAIKKALPNSRVFVREKSIEVMLKTDSGKQYTIDIVPGPTYPLRHPTVYLINPKVLLAKDGKPIHEKSCHQYHHNGMTPNGMSICYIAGSQWSSNLGLYHVAIKVLMYFYIYEKSLATGNSIHSYLS